MRLHYRTLVALFVLLIPAPLVAQDDQPVSISSDGWVLNGNLRRPDRAGRIPAVLLLNGAARDRRAYIQLAAELADRGVASLRLDLRAEGESTNRGRFEPGRNNQVLDGSDRDVIAALAWLRRQPGVDGDRLGILGASYSGEAMAQAARTGARGAAYVALSPGNFSDESARAIDSAGRPWWFIGSTQERFAGQVVRAIPSLSRSARVTLVEGTSHGSDILSPHYNLNDEIADWFAAKLSGVTSPELWGGLEAGTYPVGFRRLTFGGRIIDLWYPAETGGEPMGFADYLRLSDDLRGATPGFPLEGSLVPTLTFAMSGDSASPDPSVIQTILEASMAARRDATPLAQPSPLVLWTPRYATTVAQSVLSEYLASYGFVVAFARPTDAGRLPFELATPSERHAELDARVQDMSFAAQQLATLPGIDTLAIGVIGWSYTGEMATEFQKRDPRVTLVAGLSTTLLNDWVFQSAGELEQLDGRSLHAAFAMLTQPRGNELPPAFSRGTGARYYVEMPGLAHGSFNALEGFIPSLFGVTPVQRWSTSGDHGVRGYEAMATMLLRMLRHHVANRSPAPLAPLVLVSGLEPRTAVVR